MPSTKRKKMAATNFAAMLYDDTLIRRIREKMGLALNSVPLGMTYTFGRTAIEILDEGARQNPAAIIRLSGRCLTLWRNRTHGGDNLSNHKQSNDDRQHPSSN